MKNLRAIHTFSFFNDGKDGHNNLFKLSFLEGFEQFLSLLDSTFEPLDRELVSKMLPERFSDSEIREKNKDTFLIKEPKQIVREMHKVMTSTTKEEYRDGNVNIWHFINKDKRLCYVACHYNEKYKEWYCSYREECGHIWMTPRRAFRFLSTS